MVSLQGLQAPRAPAAIQASGPALDPLAERVPREAPRSQTVGPARPAAAASTAGQARGRRPAALVTQPDPQPDARPAAPHPAGTAPEREFRSVRTRVWCKNAGARGFRGTECREPLDALFQPFSCCPLAIAEDAIPLPPWTPRWSRFRVLCGVCCGGGRQDPAKGSRPSGSERVPVPRKGLVVSSACDDTARGTRVPC